MTLSPVLPDVGLAHDVATLLAKLGTRQLESVRVGTDVTSIAWFARLLTRRAGPATVRQVFTAAEQDYCDGRPERLAARWAGKEAVAKAIGTGFRGIRPVDIEIRHAQDGRADVAAASSATWPDGAHTWAWALSLCHENDAAMAIAIAIPTRSGDVAARHN